MYLTTNFCDNFCDKFCDKYRRTGNKTKYTLTGKAAEILEITQDEIVQTTVRKEKILDTLPFFVYDNSGR